MSKDEILKLVLPKLGMDDSEGANIKKIYSGYTSDCYKLSTSKGVFLIKEFIFKENTNYEDALHEKNGQKREYDALCRMSQIQIDGAKVPEPVATLSKEGILIEKYYEGISLNQFFFEKMIQRKFKEGVTEKFKKAAELLAEIHEKNKVGDSQSYLHGDIMNKNVLISREGEMILLDPSSKTSELKGHPKEDLADLILTLYPYNVWLLFLMKQCGRREISKMIVQEYNRHSTFKIEQETVDEASISKVGNRMSLPSSRNLMKYPKYHLMKIINKIILKMLQDE